MLAKSTQEADGESVVASFSKIFLYLHNVKHLRRGVLLGHDPDASVVLSHHQLPREQKMLRGRECEYGRDR